MDFRPLHQQLTNDGIRIEDVRCFAQCSFTCPDKCTTPGAIHYFDCGPVADATDDGVQMQGRIITLFGNMLFVNKLGDEISLFILGHPSYN